MVRALVPGARDAAIRFGRAVAKAHVERMLEGKGPTYTADAPHAQPEHAFAH